MSNLTLSLRNVRGIPEAELDLTGPIIALFGANRAGKSSICLAVQALLSGVRAPITLGKRGADDIMLARGATKGLAVLRCGAASATQVWPGGKISTEGDPTELPSSTLYASGLVSFLDLPVKEREAVFTAMFDVAPDRADLDAVLKEAGAEGSSDKLWEYIEANGWDAAAQQAKDAARELKGRWREVTGGASWGSDAGASWAPDQWHVDLDQRTETDLTGAVEIAERALHNAIASAAVAGEKRTELEKAAAETPEDTGTLDTEIGEKIKEREAAIDRRRELDTSGGDSSQKPKECWNCGSPFVLERDPADGEYKAVEPKRLSSEELRQVRAEIAALDGTIGRLGGEIQALQTTRAIAISNAQKIEAAKAELASAAKTRQAPSGPDQATAEQQLNRAKANLEVWRAKQRAAELHAQIIRQNEIAEACGPGGARKRKLRAVLTDVNACLGTLSKTMGIPAVELDDDLEITSGGASYVMLSRSEKWRVRAVLQLELARRDGSAMVVIDDVDTVLDAADRNRVLAAVKRSGTKALIATAYPRPFADPLPGAGMGRSYWVEQGRVVPMDEAAATAPEKAA